MKKIIITFTALMTMIISHANCQWTLLNNSFIYELRSVFFTNSQTGYVAGSDGLIIKTTDGGISWSQLSTGTADTLRGVYFTDDSTGYAVGAKGTIIKTTNSGISWSIQPSGNTSLLRSVYFPSNDTGYVAGGNGVILKTTDGGNNWLPQLSGTSQDLIGIRFTGTDTGYAVSSLSTFFNGLILKTVNGGSSWDTVHINVHGFLSVFPATSNIVYAVGDSGTIVKTTDGGLTWNTLSTGTLNRLRTVFFLNADTGYAAGELGTIIFTADGGNTWINQSTQTSGLLGMYFPMQDTGFVVGIAGVILRYSKPCPLPAEPVQIYGGTTVCEGATIYYYIHPVSNATTYTWSAPPGSAVTTGQGDTLVSITFGTSSGTISVTADNQCGASTPHMLLINVNANPQTPIITAIGTLLVSSPANAYQWYFNNILIPGADSSTYIPQQNGNYSVIISNSFGCTATSALFNVVNAAVMEINKNDYRISPVPFTNFFKISWNQTAGIVSGKKLVLFSVTGKLLKEINLPNNMETIVEADEITAGIYFYKIYLNGVSSYYGKIIKQ